MLRRSFSLLEVGVISSWLPKKSFGFVTVGEGENAKNIFVHQKAIIQARNQRPVQSIRKGVQIQFDIGADEQGRPTAKNITSPGGKTLSNRDEIPSTTVDVRALRGRLLQDGDEDSHHSQALRGIVQSIDTIGVMQRKTAMANRKIASLLNALAEKEGVTEIVSGESYQAVKKVVLANPLAEAAARKMKREDGSAAAADEDDLDEEEVAAEPVAEKKETKKAAKKEEKKEEFHSADDLLDLMEDEAPKKTKKGKKSSN